MLKYLAKNRLIDGILQVGDYAYDLHNDDGARGDIWFSDMEEIVSEYSFLGVPGNHEEAHNFTHYRHRFTMPMREKFESLYWSMDAGNMHIVGLDSELYFTGERWQQVQMEQWLRADLIAANRNNRRRAVPWIVVMLHRPLYCSVRHSPGKVCDKDHNPLRMYLESLLCEGGVDLVVQAHVHNYERLLPVFNRTVFTHPGQNPYVNPPTPVYIVAGAAGCQEDLQKGTGSTPWDAFQWLDYGIGLMKVHNATHLTFSQYDASMFQERGGWGSPPVDQFTIVRPQTRAFPHQACSFI